MSASTTPTEWPRAARATPRLVVTDDLPTPPLPDEISSGRVFEPGSLNGTGRPVACPCGCPWAWAWPLPCSLMRSSSRSLSLITVNSSSTLVTPSIGRRAPSTRDWISLRSGHPGTVSATSTDTVPSGRHSARRTMPRSTIERWSSGSSTGRNASTSCSEVTDILGLRLSDMPQAAPGGTAGNTFTAAVSAITDAFGDPTRRRIYLFVRSQSDGVTATRVADEVGVHPNVARHHLDKLAAGGYVEVAARPQDGSRRKAGRPSKRYVAALTDAVDEVPVHTEDLVLALLGQALARMPRAEAEAMAEEVGATYGRSLASGLTGDARAAGQRSLRSAMQAVAAALTAHGFAARTSEPAVAPGRRDVDGLRIISEHCPFG